MTAICKSCGNELALENRFCQQCGAPVLPVQMSASNVQKTEPLVPETRPTLTEQIPQPGPKALKTEKMVAAPRVAAGLQKPNSPMKLVVLGGGFLLFLAAAGLVYYYSVNPRADSPNVFPTPSPEPSPMPTTSEISGFASATPETQPSQELTRPALSTPTPALSRTPGRTPSSTPAPIPTSTLTPAPVQPTPAQIRALPPPSPPRTQPRIPTPTPVPLPPVEELIKQGATLVGQKLYQEGLAKYQEAQRRAPGNDDLYYLIGSAYHQMGKVDEALAAYRQCKTGNYAGVAANHVKKLEKKSRKSKE